jgi:hypothetical protein
VAETAFGQAAIARLDELRLATLEARRSAACWARWPGSARTPAVPSRPLAL